MKRRTLMYLLALALVLAACGGDEPAAEEGGEPTAEEEGSEDAAASGEPIRIGAVFDLSGATADVGQPYADGMRAYVEWRNASGGIEGRPIELLSQDYQYDVAVAEQLYSQYIGEGVVAFQGWGTGDTEALRTRVTSDEIPFMSASYAETLTDPSETPYNFVVALSYSDQMRVALQYIAENSDGEVSVAVFHHDSPFGQSPVADGQSYIEEQGYDITYESYAMPTGATDYVGELSQAGDPDYVIIQNVSSPAAQLASNVAAQGLDATVVCLNWCGDELFVELAGDAAEGTLGVLPFAPPQTVEDLGNVSEYLEEQGSSVEEINLHYTQGWFTMDVMATAIEQVVAAGEEVTGPAIKEALEEMGEVETPVTVPITFSAEDHSGMEAGRVYEVTDGSWTPVSDVLTP